MSDVERLRSEGLVATEKMHLAFAEAVRSFGVDPMGDFVAHLRKAVDAGDVALDRSVRVAGIEGFAAKSRERGRWFED